LINVVCDRSLLGAYTQDRHRVAGSLVRHAATEVFGRTFAPAWLPWAGAAGAGLAVIATVFLIWELFPGSRTAVAETKNAQLEQLPPPAVGITEQRPGAGKIIRGDQVTGPGTASSSALRVASLTPGSVESLSALLKKYGTETVPDGAFTKLFGMWGAHYETGADDPCTQASNQGLECLLQRGSFGQLRQYNRPVILLLNDEGGVAHQVVLTNLGDESAKVDLGGQRHEVSIGELGRLWFGDFVMLWRPGTSTVKPLSVGMRGDEVRWLRQSLQRVTGAPPDFSASDVFDAKLSELVKDFQKRNQLTVDGIAGVQTQIVLASAVATPDSPVLRSEPPRGGG